MFTKFITTYLLEIQQFFVATSQKRKLHWTSNKSKIPKTQKL